MASGTGGISSARAGAAAVQPSAGLDARPDPAPPAPFIMVGKIPNPAQPISPGHHTEEVKVCHCHTAAVALLHEPRAEGRGQAPLQSRDFQNTHLLPSGVKKSNSPVPALPPRGSCCRPWASQERTAVSIRRSLTSRLCNKDAAEAKRHLSLFSSAFGASQHKLKASYKGSCKPNRQVEEKPISRFCFHS